jgi:hypothetical protein
METNAMDRENHKQAGEQVPPGKGSGNWFRDMRLQTRLTLLILVIAVPILLAVSAVTHKFADTFMRDSANMQIEQTNYALNLKTQVWFDMNVSVLKQLALLPGITSMDPAMQKPILEITSQSFPHLYLVHTTNTAGLDVARNDSADNTDYSDRLSGTDGWPPA